MNVLPVSLQDRAYANAVGLGSSGFAFLGKVTVATAVKHGVEL